MKPFRIQIVVISSTPAAMELWGALGLADWVQDTHNNCVVRHDAPSAMVKDRSIACSAEAMEAPKYLELAFDDQPNSVISHFGMRCTPMEAAEYALFFQGRGIPVRWSQVTTSPRSEAIYYNAIYATAEILGVDLEISVKL